MVDEQSSTLYLPANAHVLHWRRTNKQKGRGEGTGKVKEDGIGRVKKEERKGESAEGKVR